MKLLTLSIVWAGTAVVSSAALAQASPPIESPRLYVLDGGVLASDPTRYELSIDDVETTDLSVAAFLIVHPRGVLLWDAGAIADRERISVEAGPEQHVVRQDGDDRYVRLGPPLAAQLAAAGFEPEDVTHLALSHYHWDHTADANTFAHATWLVSTLERDAMFAAEPPGGTRPVTYSALRNARTQIVDADEHDVFGDSSVIIKRAAGHTPGHAVLYVRLAKTGGVVLSGDLYHYPAERTLGRLPTFEYDAAQTAAARADVEAFLERTRAQLWIQHDLAAHRRLALAPAYYD